MQIHRRHPYLIAGACSILYFLPFLRVFSHNGDEGTLIGGAARVAQGQLPFRDFFEVMGPGTFYYLALFFKVFGTTWLATRINLLITTLGVTLVLLYLARRLRGGNFAPVIFFVAVSYHSWNAVSHHLDSSLVGLLAFAAFAFWMDKPRPVTIFLAGAAAGLTTWFMLPKGVLLFLSFVLLTGIFYRKSAILRPALMALVSGFAVVNAIVLGWFWAARGLRDLIYANLIWPLTNYSNSNVVPYGWEFRQLYWRAFTASFQPLLPPVLGFAVCGIFSMPFLAVMGLPVVLLGCVAYLRRAAFDRTTLPYWIAGCAFWLSEMHRKDLTHIVFASPLLIVLAFSYCWQLRGGWVKAARQMVMASAVLLAVLNPLVALSAQYKRITRRGTMYDSFARNSVIDFLNARVDPGDSLFVYPYSPMYYFLSAARNPTRYSILMYHTNTDQQFQDAIRALETNKVRYVIWDRSFPTWIHEWFPAYRSPAADKLIMEPYLAAHYRVVGGPENGYQFLERNESLPVSSLLAGGNRQ